jgi:template-activating factor I
VLKKEYKFQAPPAEATDMKDADGITESQLDFSWERDVEIGVRAFSVSHSSFAYSVCVSCAQTHKIQWKDDAHNLTKLYPQVFDEEDDIPADSGSFFNYFELAKDPYDVCLMPYLRRALPDSSHRLVFQLQTRSIRTRWTTSPVSWVE